MTVPAWRWTPRPRARWATAAGIRPSDRRARDWLLRCLSDSQLSARGGTRARGPHAIEGPALAGAHDAGILRGPCSGDQSTTGHSPRHGPLIAEESAGGAVG